MAGDIRHKGPRRLKRLDETDFYSLEDENGNIVLVTKQETANVIRQHIQDEVSKLDEYYIANQLDKIQEDFNDVAFELKKELEHQISSGLARIKSDIDQKMGELEASVGKYLDYKFDLVAEKMCEKILSKEINQEVEKRLAAKLEEIRLKKSAKGFG